DYRDQGSTRHKTMTLSANEFMRRFLLHVLPAHFHRISPHGLLANGSRPSNLARARALLHAPSPDPVQPEAGEHDSATKPPTFVCAHCGCAMLIIHTFARANASRAPPRE